MGGIQGSNSYTGFYKDPFVFSVQTITTGGVSRYYLINWTTAGTATTFAPRIMGNVSLPFAVPTYPGGILGYNTFCCGPRNQHNVLDGRHCTIRCRRLPRNMDNGS